jgi:chromosome segregation ATPase
MQAADIDSTVAAASDALAKLQAGLTQAQTEEDAARTARDAAIAKRKQAETDLGNARTAEQQAIATLGAASSRRADWQNKVNDFNVRLNALNNDLSNLQAASNSVK